MLKVQNGGNVVFDQKADKPFRIAFRVRVNQFLESRNPPYFSLVLHGEDSYQGRFMFRGDNIIEHYLFKNNKRRQGFGGISRYSVTPGEWLQLELTVMKSFVQLSCDGKVISTAKYEGLIPLESISFGTYNTVWELDDLSCSILREEAPKTVAKPVFRIDFDRNLEGQDPAGAAVRPVRASGVVLEPGVEGKALKLSAGKGGAGVRSAAAAGFPGRRSDVLGKGAARWPFFSVGGQEPGGPVRIRGKRSIPAAGCPETIG